MTPPSFPNRPGDADRGVFQTAPNYAVDFHFRPLINFVVRFPSFRFVFGGLRLALALRERKHRSVAWSDRGAGLRWILKMYGRRRARCPGGWKLVVALAGATPWLFAFWESFDIPSAGEKPGFANRGIHVGSFQTEWGDPDCLAAMLVEPSGGNKSLEMKMVVRVAEHFGPAAKGADPAAVMSSRLSVAVGSASPLYSSAVVYSVVEERM